MRQITPLRPAAGSLAPTDLTVQDQRRIQEALDSSTSPNTRRAYNQAWRRFEAWAKDRGHGHPLPASPELVAAVVAMGLAKMRSHSEKTKFDVMPSELCS